MERRILWNIGTALLIYASAVPAEAASILGVVNFSSTTAARFANSIGLALDHRSYEGATSLSAQGKTLDLGLDVTLTHLNSDFTAAMADLSGSTSFAFPFFPATGVNLHKSVGQNVDVGVSWINLPSGILPFGLLMLGFDMKVMIWNQEESPTWALRLSYGQSTFMLPLGSQTISDPLLGSATGTASMTLYTWSWCPQLIVSRQLDWAEGYLGVGYRIPSAKLNVAMTFTPPFDTFNQSATEQGTAAGSFEAYTGLSLRVPGIGIHLTMEGWYSSVTAFGLGTKLGATF